MLVVSCSPATHSGQKRSDRSAIDDEGRKHRDVDDAGRRFDLDDSDLQRRMTK